MRIILLCTLLCLFIVIRPGESYLIPPETLTGTDTSNDSLDIRATESNNDLSEVNFTHYEEDQENKEKQKIVKWECFQSETEKSQDITETNYMLKKGEEELSKLNISEVKETVLILGNAGAGKTTFVQFMTTDNTKLISKEVDADTGEYIIEDIEKKIGTSFTESLTLYPEVYKTSDLQNLTVFTDTPGFSDTRTSRHEVVATYTMKKYLQNIKSVKIVLLITYSSVQRGMYKDDFVNLLRNVNNFIKDIEKYKNNLILIASKVPNIYKVKQGVPVLVEDKHFITSIGEYIFQVKLSLSEKLKQPEIGLKEKNFLQNAIKIVESLLQTNENGQFLKINIFRRPSQSGPLSDMNVFQNGKESIQKMIFNNINYNEISENSIGYTLSGTAKNYLNCLVWYLNENISKISSEIYDFFKEHYELEVKNCTGIFNVAEKYSLIHEKLEKFKNDLKESKDFTEYMNKIKKFSKDEKIEFDKTENKTVTNIHEYLTNLNEFVETGPILSSLFWTEEMNPLINFIKENSMWYNFVIKLYERFSSYEFRSAKTKFHNVSDINKIHNTTSRMQILFENWDILQKDINTYMKVMSIDAVHKSEIDTLVEFAMNDDIKVLCDANGKLTVEGFYIKISSISSKEILKKYCGDKLRAISVLAIDTVFIDADIDDGDYFRGVDILIASPRWEVIGSKKIVIRGLDGKLHTITKAQNGNNYGESGKDGVSGFGGGNGGNFFAIGLDVINFDRLLVDVSGGEGGTGQDGGDGKNGSDGKNAVENVLKEPLTDNNYDYLSHTGYSTYPTNNDTWQNMLNNHSTKEFSWNYCHVSTKVYLISGSCGAVGGTAGAGGSGGPGGLPGTFLMIGQNELLEIPVENFTGSSGKSGKSGNFGNRGLTGYSMRCFKHIGIDTRYRTANNFWDCKRLELVARCNDDKNTSKFNSTFETHTILQLNKTKEYDFSDDMHRYTLLLKAKIENTFLKDKISKLLNKIYERIPNRNRFIFSDLFS